LFATEILIESNFMSSNESRLAIAAKSDASRDSKHQIRVSGLSWATDEAFLREMFEDVGDITAIHIPKDKASGHCRGFAFIGFSDGAAIARAIDNFHDTEVEDMRIRVERSAPREEVQQFGVVYERSKAQAMREGKERHERRKNAAKKAFSPF
jgi:RNA recognition motif-containing protein